MKAIVFGATLSAKALYEEIKKKYEIVAYCDNDKNKWGSKLNDKPIVSPQAILNMQWDEVIIMSLSAMNVIKKQLLDMGILANKINTNYVEAKVKGRELFVGDYAKLIYAKGMPGCIAEAGVFQGEFAQIINESFPDRKLYLFDTFEGFDERDVEYETENDFSNAMFGHLNLTSEALVMSKMKYPQNCIIKKGYFPESANGLQEKFCFVNLDMDLYKPTLEGLRFFYPQMVQGGIILVHDYFSEGYEGIKVAVNEFLEEVGDRIMPFPIGDHTSIAIQKK